MASGSLGLGCGTERTVSGIIMPLRRVSVKARKVLELEERYVHYVVVGYLDSHIKERTSE